MGKAYRVALLWSALILVLFFAAMVLYYNVNLVHLDSVNLSVTSIQNTISTTTTMKLTSDTFEHNAPIPPRYTCDGENIHPPLSIRGVPQEAKTLVLIVDDPDAPMGTWLHWTLWNIPAATVTIHEGEVPSGAFEGITSFGKPGYGGPCPPSGTHRYFFKLYALDASLSLESGAPLSELIKAMQGHILAKTELIGLYRR
jgi:Raf kinase inhibitor-like YbhB/YbcL family protein